MEAMGGVSPELYVFPDLAPQALVVKSLHGRGAILLSEGLLGLLTESELRELLINNVMRIRSPGMVFQSVCACIAHGVLALAPLKWQRILIEAPPAGGTLTAVSGLWFLALISVARALIQLSHAASMNLNAPHSFIRSSALVRRVTNPGTCVLHHVDPCCATFSMR
jgi:hypothetical protein